MNRTLYNVGWRYLARHPWQSILMILGIALGVSVMVAIDLANAAAARALDLSTDTIACHAPDCRRAEGVDEAIYAQFKAVTALAPVDGLHRFAGTGATVPATARRAPLLKRPSASYLVTSPAQTASVGDSGRYRAARRARRSHAAHSRGPGRRPWAGAGRPGAAQRGPDGNPPASLPDCCAGGRLAAARWTARCWPMSRPHRRWAAPAGSATSTPSPRRDRRGGRRAGLSGRRRVFSSRECVLRRGRADDRRAPNGNLTALVLLALVVGMFLDLLDNSMTFSARSAACCSARCAVSASRRAKWAVSCSARRWSSGTPVAAGAGRPAWPGRGAAWSATINDLYFVVTVRYSAIDAGSLLKGFLLGVAATVASTALPAWRPPWSRPAGACPFRLEDKVVCAAAITAAAWRHPGGHGRSRHLDARPGYQLCALPADHRFCAARFPHSRGR